MVSSSLNVHRYSLFANMPRDLRVTIHGSRLTVSYLDLDVFAFEPLDHELVLLPRRKAGPDRFPGAARADAAVFRLGDADQAFLRHGIDRMVVDLIAPLKLPRHCMLARERVGLVHRHQP